MPVIKWMALYFLLSPNFFEKVLTDQFIHTLKIKLIWSCNYRAYEAFINETNCLVFFVKNTGKIYVTQGKQGIPSQLECGQPVNDYLLYRHRVSVCNRSICLNPSGGSRISQGTPSYYSANFFLKTTWKWRKLNGRGQCLIFVYSDPPLNHDVMQCLFSVNL